ncbi:hypothetical protein [Kitasatospora sp. NPDC094016]|uniref:hypothetical protein n=1 Tax=Kitasatospora sp. NPDC094016 TaxID=3154986 RepID=UPI00332E4BA4
MTDRWPDKAVPDFTTEELCAAIERHQDDPDSATQSIVRDCIQEWERRRGLPQT